MKFLWEIYGKPFEKLLKENYGKNIKNKSNYFIFLLI